jgi:hypothetical protein
LVDALGGVIWQAGQDVSKPSLRIDVVELGGGDEGVDRGRRQSIFRAELDRAD